MAEIRVYALDPFPFFTHFGNAHTLANIWKQARQILRPPRLFPLFPRLKSACALHCRAGASLSKCFISSVYIILMHDPHLFAFSFFPLSGVRSS